MLLAAEAIQQIEQNGSLTQGISNRVEYVAYKGQPIIDYFVTAYPRFCSTDIPQPQILFSYKDNTPNISFSHNQPNVIAASNLLFENSINLDRKLQDILDISFARTLLDKPTRPNRK